MKKRFYLFLFLAGFVVNLTAAFLQPVPGYMDADYYYSGGLQLANGKGFNEPFIWNYLDNPQAIPHPSHTYWMPLASILAAVGMFLTRSTNFLSARLFLILLASAIPPITASLAYKLNRNLESSLLAGLLAVFSGFYLMYTSDTETFAIYMAFGGLFILVANRLIQSVKPAWSDFIFLGLISGFMHLARADGILWFGTAGLMAVWLWLRYYRHSNIKIALLNGIGILASVSVGYLLLMSPWYIRNLNLYGSLFSPAGLHTLWITNYDQMFNYPVSQLNFSNWLINGLGQALQARLDSFKTNLESAMAVQGEIFLLPLILIGLWRLRKEWIIKLGLGIWVITLLIMTLVFPFAGERGGFFHSSAAIEPVFWAVVPVGLDGFVSLGVRWRKWSRVSAVRFLGIGLVLLSIFFTGILFYQRVFGTVPGKIAWSSSWDQYSAVGAALDRSGADPGSIVLVNNPPGYFVATGQSGLVIPNGDEQTSLEVANRYGASYLILEKDHVKGLDELFMHPGDRPGLKYLMTVGQIYIFQILKSP
ncbi:MAG: hypothetical protein P4L50_12935 [Anaerolineaceae bacterium]|nr:hypothetical protein [Anaerolineaceae bacterium]